MLEDTVEIKRSILANPFEKFERKRFMHHCKDLAYIAWLFEGRRWLAGDDLSMADITAAAHLSVLDYMGDVPWSVAPLAKDWYARMKSRPSFPRNLTSPFQAVTWPETKASPPAITTGT